MIAGLLSRPLTLHVVKSKRQGQEKAEEEEEEEEEAVEGESFTQTKALPEMFRVQPAEQAWLNQQVLQRASADDGEDAVYGLSLRADGGFQGCSQQ